MRIFSGWFGYWWDKWWAVVKPIIPAPRTIIGDLVVDGSEVVGMLLSWDNGLV